MSEAKEEILARIARAGVTGTPELVRQRVLVSSRDRGEIVEQFVEFAAEYRANLIRTDRAGLMAAVLGALKGRGSNRVVISPDLPEEVRPAGVDLVEDEAFDNGELDEFQAVLTTCAVAVAETGTVVLDGGVGQGKRAITLVPDHHVCVVFEEQVVDSVAEAVQRLEAAVLRGQPLTWISGPSATSDIELSRVEGVHGPRVLDIVLVR